jgi:uncharacterized protein (UPF0548 family)
MAVAQQPRWSFHAPGEAAIGAFLSRLRANGNASHFSYLEVGASRHDAERPRGYTLDHNRIQLGEGVAAFEAACAALRAWRMFPSPWTRISPVNAPLRVGEIVVMQARALGLWWMNGAEIVYVIDERGEATNAIVRRFGFAYGTLRAHVEEGEERFSVELHGDGRVWYDLRAFSRPRYWPVRIGKRIARRLQARFVRESQAAMRAAVVCSQPVSGQPRRLSTPA